MRLTNEGIRGMPAYDKDFRQANSPWLWAGTRTLDGTISPWSDAPLGSIYILIVTDKSSAFYVRVAAADATASWANLPAATASLGVTIHGVRLYDGHVIAGDGKNVYADHIVEAEDGHGVNVDGVKLKDGTLGVTNSAQAGTNEVQSITVDATGGTFTVTYSGQTTAALNWNITAAALQTALAGLSSVGAGHVVVTGGPGATAPLVCTFQGALGSTDLGAMTTGAGSLTGGAGTATVAEDVKGVAAALTGPLTKKLQIFDATGASLGYVALYDAIT